MANPNTSSFPYAAATDTALTVASDNAQTTLAGDIDDSTLSIDVASASLFIVPCVIVIDGEIILATSKVSDTFTNCVRGFAGTSAVSHTDTTPVFGYIVAYQHNQMAVEVKSVSSYIFNDDFSGFKKSENLVHNSEDFSQGYWAKASGVTVAPDVNTLPDSSSMTFFTEGDSSGQNMLSGVPDNLTNGADYTFSVYAKYDSVRYIVIGQNLAGTEQRWAWFDLQNGVIATVGDVAHAAMVPIGGTGIYRCMVVTACTTDSYKAFDIALATTDGSKTYLGTATNGNIISGAQVRSGGLDGSLSYVKTGATSFSLTGGGDLVLDEGDLS